MNRALLKDYVREIKNTFNRFFAILIIIAVGVSFFVGIRATGPDMRDSADTYLNESQLMDIKVMSNYGISEEDLEAIRKMDQVGVAVGSYTTDMLDVTDERGYNIKVISLPSDTKDSNTEYINRLHLVEGNLPQRSGEIVIDNWRRDIYQIEVGDVITLDTGQEGHPVDEFLKVNTFKVVGIASTPLFLSYDKGSSTVGNGIANIFAAVLEEDFNMRAYTEAYIRLKSVRGLSAFSKEYKEAVGQAVSDIEKELKNREDLKLEELKDEIANDLADEIGEEPPEGDSSEQEEPNADGGGLDNPDAEGSGSQADLEQLRNDFEEAEAELKQQRQEFDEKFAAAKLDLDNAGEQLKEAESAYNTSYSQWKTQKAEFDTKNAELEEAKAQAAESEVQIQDSYATASTLDAIAVNPQSKSQQEISALVSKLQGTNPQLASLLSGYVQGTVRKNEFQTGIASYRQGIKSQETELGKKNTELNTHQAELNQMESRLTLAKSELDEQEKNIKQLRNYVETGQPAYEEERNEALANLNAKEAELEDKKQKLEDAEGTVESMEEVAFYVYDRDVNPGYSSYEENSDRITAVAQVFPVFFFFVAALVCLTTMTRMVEEQRTQIGILKAIGYSPMQIIGKYLLYSTIAGVLGTAIALFIGFQLYPGILMNVYSIMYYIPYRLMPMRLDSCIISVIVALLCTMATSFFACKTELIEQAAVLMRPKSPKGGKRILLERIAFLWNRLTYKLKVTARNIFRYKLRMIMTIVGIAGCTALMITGWGLQDSISEIVNLQFDEINVYNIMSTINLQSDQEDIDSLENLLETHSAIEESMYGMQETVDVLGEKVISANIIVPKTPETFSNFIYIRNSETKEPISLDNDGVVVTQKLAKLLKLEPGDEILLKDSNNIEHLAVVSDIAENYALHFIYITPALYKNIFAKEAEYNTVTLNLKEVPENEKDAQEAEIGEALTNQDCILSSTFNSQTAASFDDTMSSFNVVVYVLIISAAILAFVVLYNLTNINVSERIRELATIKVLGFQDGEVTSYVYRENFILTLMGIAVGIFVGIFLHHYVVETAEIDNALFIRQIKLASYFMAAGFTIVYSLLVNFVMHFKLKRLDMVEALKSVE